MCSTGRRAGWLVMISLGMWGGLRGDDPYQPPGILWEREYDWAEFNSVHYPNFAPFEEGGGILTGRIIGRIDSAGEILWTRSMPEGATILATPTLSGDQFVLPFRDAAGDAHLLSMSTAGDTVWEKPVPIIPTPPGGEVRVTAAFRMSGGSFLFGGYVASSTGGELNGFLLEVSQDGTFGAPQYFPGQVFWQLEPLPSGGVLLLEVLEDIPLQSYQVWKLDTAGAVEWDRQMAPGGGKLNNWVRGTASGGFVMHFDDRLDWFDSEGMLVHSRLFEFPESYSPGFNFRALPDAGLIIVFRVGAEVHLVRTDARGEILWRLSGWPGGAFTNVGVEPDGSFLVILGGKFNGSEYKAVVFRTEPDPVLRSTVSFIRGDANGDGQMDLSDAIFTLSYLFLGNRAPGCLRAADLDGDGRLDLSDAVYGLQYHFSGGLPPTQPFPGCGVDPATSLLSCGRFAGCE